MAFNVSIASDDDQIQAHKGKQWKEGRGNGKKFSKSIEIVFHTGLKKIVYQKVGYKLFILLGVELAIHPGNYSNAQ